MKQFFKETGNICTIDGADYEYDLCTERKGLVDEDKYILLGKGTTELNPEECFFYKKK